mmetsp:Transcript_5920/g.12985  ORF Transcript_5920/g.12985 Transcript_5920/m.12985 type:complete len:85 (-) Transcript_5920:285-539(-)
MLRQLVERRRWMGGMHAVVELLQQGAPSVIESQAAKRWPELCCCACQTESWKATVHTPVPSRRIRLGPRACELASPPLSIRFVG